jgi:serralysin
LSNTDVKVVKFFGDVGNETLDGSATNTPLEANGGEGDNVLISGKNVDTLTGGSGADFFTYAGDPFAAGTPAPAGTTGINALNRPDRITDYEIGRDRFAFSAAALGLNHVAGRSGTEAAAPGSNSRLLPFWFR